MQYMDTKQDFGSWLFGLAEISIAPIWNFEISGMYNLQPKKENPKDLRTYDRQIRQTGR